MTTNWKRIIACLCLSLSFFAAVAAETDESDRKDAGKMPAQIAVSPVRAVFRIDDARPVSGQVRLINLGDHPVTIESSVLNWTLDEDGNLKEIPPTEQSLDQWIILFPVRFTLAPRESQVVRYMIRPNAKPSPGERRALIFFTKNLEGEETKGSFRIRFRIGVPVYAVTGPVRRAGKIDRVRLLPQKDGAHLDFDLRNDGDVTLRLRGKWGVWAKKDFPGKAKAAAVLKETDPRKADPKLLAWGEVPGSPVLPHSQRGVGMNIGIPKGAGDKILWIGGRLVWVDSEIDGGASLPETPFEYRLNVR